MNNKTPKPTHPQQQNLKKLPQLQLLKLEQLDGVSGGPRPRGPETSPAPRKSS